MKKMNYRQKAWAYLAAITAVFGICFYLIAIDVLNAATLIVAAFGCYPMVKYIWNAIRFEKLSTIRILKSALPKCGFSIENTEWNDDKTAIRIHGKYQGDIFMVEAYHSSPYVKVVDMPWTHINASDPNIPRLLEAINETNAEAANMNVYLMEADEEGKRHIYTHSKTILPSYHPEQYLDSLMCDMLNRKRALHENFGKVHSRMTQPRGTIGFRPFEGADSSNETPDGSMAAQSPQTAQ